VGEHCDFTDPALIIEKALSTSMDDPKTREIGIILDGVTGRMGTNQHLKRSILPIMEQGGVPIGDEQYLVPDPILVGRNADKLRRLSEDTGVEKWSTDVEKALSDDHNEVYFDAKITELRHESVSRALEAGTHVYCEKPSGMSTEEALDLYHQAEDAGVVHGVVQDKLWLPGLQKLKRLVDTGFFGDILSVRGEFGYWVFRGNHTPAQRPSWNYRAEDGGGIILDMLCHYRYILDNLFGDVQAVSCLGVKHIDERWDEEGDPYEATAEDAAYATFELEGDIVVQLNSSWATRVRRDDLFTLQVDGTKGSAVAGLRNCVMQPLDATPKPVWNPDEDTPHSFYDDWMPVATQQEHENAFKTQWELFLQHVAAEEPFPWDLLEGAKGVQLAEKGYDSSDQRAWLDVPPLVE
jgi:predicted dehydrogenase